MTYKSWLDRLIESQERNEDWKDTAFPTPCLVCGQPVNRFHKGIRTRGSLGAWGVHDACLILAIRERWSRVEDFFDFFRHHIRGDEAPPAGLPDEEPAAERAPLKPENKRYRRARLRHKRQSERHS